MAKTREFDIVKYHAPFPSRLRELLTENAMSESELASKIGVSKQSVSYYSNGTSFPDIGKLIKIANVFSVSLDYLVGESDLKMTDVEALEYTYIMEKKPAPVDIDKRVMNAVNSCLREMRSDRAKDVFTQIMKSESFQEFINKLSAVQAESADYSDLHYDLWNPAESIVYKDRPNADIVTVYKERTEEKCRELQSTIHRIEEIMAAQKMKRYELFDLCNAIIEEIGYYSDARKITEKELMHAREKMEELELFLKEE